MGGETSLKFDANALETGRKIFAQECRFILGAANPDQVPLSHLPEIAFAGRSNVGKSSLLNALTGRKNLARTSNTPGRTREINFFELGTSLMIADLPGYGYARAPKARIRTWTALGRTYLRGRAQLRRACLLVDSRHGLKDSDRDIMTLLDEAAVNYQLVLTKGDKIKANEVEKVQQAATLALAQHPAAYPHIHVTSAVKGLGLAALRAALSQLILFNQK